MPCPCYDQQKKNPETFHPLRDHNTQGAFTPTNQHYRDKDQHCQSSGQCTSPELPSQRYQLGLEECPVPLSSQPPLYTNQLLSPLARPLSSLSTVTAQPRSLFIVESIRLPISHLATMKFSLAFVSLGLCVAPTFAQTIATVWPVALPSKGKGRFDQLTD